MTPKCQSLIMLLIRFATLYNMLLKITVGQLIRNKGLRAATAPPSTEMSLLLTSMEPYRILQK